MELSMESCLKKLGFEGVFKYDEAEIRKRFKLLAKKYHPDVYEGSPNEFKSLTLARDYILENGETGVKYDLRGVTVTYTDGSTPFEYKFVGGV